MTSLHTRADLTAQPVPSRTETYTPIPCSLILDTVDTLVKEQGIYIVKENFFLSRKGEQQRLQFLFGSENSSKFNRELVLINSYDKSLALRGASGVAVFVCSNGTIIGDVKIYNKHTGTIDEKLQEFLRECIEDTKNVMDFSEEMFASFSSVILTKREQAELLGRVYFEEEILSPNQISIVKKEIEKPSYDYGCPTDSLWQLYQHTTLALRNEPAISYIQTRRDLQMFFEDYYAEANRIDPSLFEWNLVPEKID